MANKEKKNIALHPETYERLSKLAAQLRIDNPGGGFVSMSEAVGVLLDAYGNRNGFIIRKKDNHALFVLDRKYACDPNAIFTMVKSEALVFDNKFEAEDFGFVNSGWLQGFEVAPINAENETE